MVTVLCKIIKTALMLVFDTGVRGFHFYRKYWNPKPSEKLFLWCICYMRWRYYSVPPTAWTLYSDKAFTIKMCCYCSSSYNYTLQKIFVGARSIGYSLTWCGGNASNGQKYSDTELIYGVCENILYRTRKPSNTCIDNTRWIKVVLKKLNRES